MWRGSELADPQRDQFESIASSFVTMQSDMACVSLGKVCDLVLRSMEA